MWTSSRTIASKLFTGIHLDYGSNDGHVLVHLFNHAQQLYSADVENKLDDNYKKKIFKSLDINIDNSKIESIPNDFFDSASCIHVLEHVPTPKNVIDELFRIIKSNGLIYIETPNERSLYTPTLSSGRTWNFYDDKTHIQPFSSTSLKALAEQSGFEVLDSGIYRENKYAFALPFAPIISLFLRDMRPLHYSIIHSIGWSSFILCKKP